MWERVAMSFAVVLPKTFGLFYYIWILVDRLTKSNTSILSIWLNSEKLAKIYIYELVQFHGVPISILSDIGIELTSIFWRTLQAELDTKLILILHFTLKCFRICFARAWLILMFIVISSYPWHIVYTTIAITQVLVWTHSLYGRRCRSLIGLLDAF